MEYMIVNGELCHHGIKGQKWGVRRYQNPDGSLTAAGKRRYGTAEAIETKKEYKQAKKEYNKAFKKAYVLNAPRSVSKKRREASAERWNVVRDKAKSVEKAHDKHQLAAERAKEIRKEALNDPEYKKVQAIGKTATLAVMALSGAYALSQIRGID